MLSTFPTCPKCFKTPANGARIEFPMVPLSDYAVGGSSVEYKAWACVSADCKYVVKITKGNVEYTKGTQA